MRKITITILVIILLAGFANAKIIPRGDSVEIRYTGNWNINDENADLVNQLPDPAEPGGYVELRFKLENIGGEIAENLIFELLLDFPFTIDKSMPALRRVGDLHTQQVGEEAYVLYYKLVVDKDAIEGNNPIKIRYSSDSGISWSQKEFDVRIETHDAILSIDSTESKPSIVAPGQNVELSINLKNKGDSLLKDIKVNLEILTKTVTASAIIRDELPFSPIGSSNEKSIEDISAYETKKIVFNLITDADAKSKVYKLPINIQYSDKLGNNYSKSYVTSLIVGETPDLIVSLDSTEIIEAKESGIVTVKFTNKGASDIKFLYVKLLESDYYNILSSDDSYVGNIDSDDYETVDFSLFIEDTDEKIIQLPLKVEYRDAGNKQFTKDYIVNHKLYSSKEAKKYDLKEDNKKSAIIAIIIILAALIFYFRRMKKKKNKQ